MRKILLLFLFITGISAGWGFQLPADAAYESLRVGNLTVERLKMGKNQDFLFSNILFPKQKRNVKVLAYVNFPFRNAVTESPNYLKENPGYFLAVEALFPYVKQAWQDWREAANAWLPAAYKLPELTFSLTDGYRTDTSHTPRWTNQTINITLEATSGKYGFYQGNGSNSVRGVGISSFTKDGNGFGRILFFMEQEWLDWLNAKEAPADEQARAAEEYKKAVSAQMAGDFYEAATNGNGYNWDKQLSDRSKQYIHILSKMPAASWHKQGPWAVYNQRIVTHEWGHLLGLVHINEDTSIMFEKTASGMDSSRPSAADGLRLATLVCWYHNQQAHQEVCLPKSAHEESQELKESLKKSLNSQEFLKTAAPLQTSIIPKGLHSFPTL